MRPDTTARSQLPSEEVDTSVPSPYFDPAWKVTKAQKVADKKLRRKLEKPRRLKKKMAPPHG